MYRSALIFQFKTAFCFGVAGAIIQPYYYKCYSFRRNCFDGFELGFVVGWVWPISVPFIAYRVIRDTIDSDPLQEELFVEKKEEKKEER